MRFLYDDKFLTKGSITIDETDVKAVAIAGQSTVDLVRVGGALLTPMTFVPAQPGMNVLAVRQPYSNALEGVNGVGALGARTLPTDNNLFPSEMLVLAVYGKNDPIIPPGPRAPYVNGCSIRSGAPTTAATAQLMARIPFSGRRQCNIHCAGSNNDVFLIVRGVKYPVNDLTQGAAGFTDEQPQDDLWNGAAATPVTLIASGLDLARTFVIGGGADFQEDYDELQVWAYTTNAAQVISIVYEAFGEKVF